MGCGSDLNITLANKLKKGIYKNQWWNTIPEITVCNKCVKKLLRDVETDSTLKDKII